MAHFVVPSVGDGVQVLTQVSGGGDAAAANKRPAGATQILRRAKVDVSGHRRRRRKSGRRQRSG